MNTPNLLAAPPTTPPVGSAPPLPPPNRPAPPSPAKPPSRGVKLAWLIPGAILAAASLWFGTFNLVTLLAHEEYTVRHEFAAAEVTSIDVATVNGSITVTGDATDTVVVVAEVSDGWRPTGVEVAVVDGVLRVRGTCPVFGSQWCDADFRVSVPPDIAVRVDGSNGRVTARGLTGDVDVDTDNGRIELSDVSGEVRATNDNGSIIGERLLASRVDARTDNGRVELSFVEPPDVVVGRSHNGRIDIAVPDDEVAYRVVAESDNGSTETLVRTDPSSTNTIDVATRNGSITVRPPG